MKNYKIINKDFRDCKIPQGLVITDPPYNQNYHYNNYKDKLAINLYINLLAKIPRPCVVIHYPEETINILPKALGEVSEVITWVYNSNTGKQSRCISFWGCKPKLSLLKQPCKNPTDKRVNPFVRSYDWWEVNQVKNVSKEKTAHPCQIPEKIIKNILTVMPPLNNLVIDTFCGSGTTLKVATEMGYDSIGYEISEEYCSIAESRLKT
mgnify:FL=1